MKQKYRLRIATLIALLVMAVAGMSAQPHKKGAKAHSALKDFRRKWNNTSCLMQPSHQQSQLASFPCIERWARR